MEVLPALLELPPPVLDRIKNVLSENPNSSLFLMQVPAASRPENLFTLHELHRQPEGCLVLLVLEAEIKLAV
jgi:hypothetical protein